MSVKDLFEKQKLKVIANQSPDSQASDVESAEWVASKMTSDKTVYPRIDFTTASNFARWGSAEQYYKDAWTRIADQYPYDGSKTEKQQWIQNSSQFDLFIFDTEYPRTTGYITLSYNSGSGWGDTSSSGISAAPSGGYGFPSDVEYIEILGGPHTSSGGMIGKSLHSVFTSSNKFHDDLTASYDFRYGTRESNLKYDLNYVSGGVTLEFWFKKESFDATKTRKEIIFDLWNGKASSSTDYGRLTVELTSSHEAGTPFRLTCMSGTTGVNFGLLGSDVTTGSLESWQHYAISVGNTGNGHLQAKLYISGTLNDERVFNNQAFTTPVTGALNAYIGALRTAPSGATDVSLTSSWKGAGKLSASIDEFRYWKGLRTAKDIGRNWWTQYAGGSNTDLSNTSLGVYYKFNEGVCEIEKYDTVLLDYSGRITNGSWVGYTLGARNTGSAIVSSSYTSASAEFHDPIIYRNHPTVAATYDRLLVSGSEWDLYNNATIFGSIPEWITTDDDPSTGTGANQLLQLTQIMGSYFDTVHAQIDFLNQIKDPSYMSGSSLSSRAFEHSKRLLEDQGLLVPELFIDADIISQIDQRDETREYEMDLVDVKNMIYQNIYNNLTYMLKSKGTEKSLRNMLRCFGVDDELIKINLYADSVKYKFLDNYRTISVRKNYADFNDPDRFDASVYQQTASNNADSVSFISGSGDDAKEPSLGMTTTCEVYFPNKLPEDHEAYYDTPFTTASVWGMHTADGDSPTDFAYTTTTNYANFHVYAIRDELESPHVSFMLSSSAPYYMPTLTSSLFYDVYDGDRWHLSVRVKPQPVDLVASGSSGSYDVEFHGVQMIMGTALNEFLATGSMTNAQGKAFLKSGKRLYAGAQRTNVTSSTVVKYSDVRLSSVRYWADYLELDALYAHAKDSKNVGVLYPDRSISAANTTLNNRKIHKANTLALHWSFNNLSSSDDGGDAVGTAGSSDAGFWVEDDTSGSATLKSRDGWMGGITGPQHTARGSYYMAGDTGSISQQHISTMKQNIPEAMSMTDQIEIRSQDDLAFTKDSRPINMFYAIEKSMYQTISEEMLNMFATIVEFNNLIGEPVHRYRQEYKDLSVLRQMFFEKVKNTPDLDKYIQFYKWLDSALSILLMQLMPASANSSNGIRTLVESHVLERNKYWNKFPTLEMKVDDPESGAEGINKHLYNWRFGHAPISKSERDNVFWWNQRAERDEDISTLAGAAISSSVADVNTDRARMLSSSVQVLTRKYTTPFRFAVDESKEYRGGVNAEKNKKRDLVYTMTTPAGHINVPTEIPKNIMIVDDIDVGTMDRGPTRPGNNDLDILEPNRKYKYNFKLRTFKDDQDPKDSYVSIMKGSFAVPFVIVSSSVTSGYNADFIDKFMSGAQITNLHHDAYGPDYEVPMQGPFTNKYVGGHQSRHIELNSYASRAAGSASAHAGLDSHLTRPEAWKLLFGPTVWESFEHDTVALVSASMLGFVGADYPHPVGNPGEPSYPVTAALKATRYREEHAKRPVNIRNIMLTTGSYTLGAGHELLRHAAQTKAPTVLGNYRKPYNYVHTAGRITQRRYLRDFSGSSVLPEILTGSGLHATTNPHALIGIYNPRYGGVGVVFGRDQSQLFRNRKSDDSAYEDGRSVFEMPRRQKQEVVFVNRFSAPGSWETSHGFLDVHSGEYSVYNSLNYRNMFVRGSSSGEGNASIYRVSNHMTRDMSHLTRETRDGLAALLQRPAGRFGIDSVYGAVTAEDYDASASFHKVPRNLLRRLEFNKTGSYDLSSEGGPSVGASLNSETFTTASKYDNFYIQHPIPRSDFQYKWIHDSAGRSMRTGSHWSKKWQQGDLWFGYAPVDGVLSGSDPDSPEMWASAFTWPTSSDYGFVTALSGGGVAEGKLINSASYAGHANSGSAKFLFALNERIHTGSDKGYNNKADTNLNTDALGRQAYRSYRFNWAMKNFPIVDPVVAESNSLGHFASGAHSPPGISVGINDDGGAIDPNLREINERYEGRAGIGVYPLDGTPDVFDSYRWVTASYWAGQGGDSTLGRNPHVAFEAMVIAADGDGIAGRKGGAWNNVKTGSGDDKWHRWITMADDNDMEEHFAPPDGAAISHRDLVTNVELTNALILQRNRGPHGWPSWKQIRGSEHPVVIAQRKTNTISVLDEPVTITLPMTASSTTLSLSPYVKSWRGHRFTNYVEPVVSRNHPMVTIVGDAAITHTYNNNLEMFSNPVLNERLGTFSSNEEGNQMYDSLLPTYATSTGITRVGGLQRPSFGLKYTETVFPRKENAHQRKSYYRENWNTMYWKDKRWERMEGRGALFGIPFGLPISHSNYPSAGGFVEGRHGLSQSYWPFAATNHGVVQDASDTPGLAFVRIASASVWPLDARQNFVYAPIAPVLGWDYTSSVDYGYGTTNDGNPFGNGINPEQRGEEFQLHATGTFRTLSSDGGLRGAITGHPTMSYFGYSPGSRIPDPAINGSNSSWFYVRGAPCGILQNSFTQFSCSWNEELERQWEQSTGLSAAEMSTQRQYVLGKGPKSRPMFMAGPIYARRHTLPTASSLYSPSHGFAAIEIMADTTATPGGTNHWRLSGSNTINTDQMFGGDTLWEAGDQAAAQGSCSLDAPFYESYEDYAKDLKSRGKGYGLIPEFRISDHMENYIVNHDGNFMAENLDYFNVTGASGVSGSSEDDFFKIYSNTDFMKHFEKINNDHDFTGGPASISLKMRAIKKFVPYSSFYPALHTVEMSKLFAKCYGEYVINPARPADHEAGDTFKWGAMNNEQAAFYKPFFGPGVLFNAIKSGIAVDYPFTTGSTTTFAAHEAVAAPYWPVLAGWSGLPVSASTLAGGAGHDWATIPWLVENKTGATANSSLSMSYDYSSQKMLGVKHGNADGPGYRGFLESTAELLAFCAQNNNMLNWSSYSSNVDHGSARLLYTAESTVYNPQASYYKRLPFEALVEPEKYVKDQWITWDEPHPSCSFTRSFAGGGHMPEDGTWSATFTPSMGTASWNGDGDMRYKLAMSNFLAEVPTFFLKGAGMSTMVSRPESDPQFGVAERGKVYAAMVKLRKSRSKTGQGRTVYDVSGTLQQDGLGYERPSEPYPETITMYSRPSAFGPPTYYSFMGFYPQYTPPYYDGEAWAILRFTGSDEGITPNGFGGQFNKFTLDEILQHTQVEYVRVSHTGSVWAVVPHQSGSGLAYRDGLCLHDRVNDQAMQVSASLNLFQKAEIKSVEYDAITGLPLSVTDDPTGNYQVWAIQPKWETPILNFKGVDVTMPKYGSGSCARGMWHQYGRTPTGSEGIYMEIVDVPESYILNGPTGLGQFDTHNGHAPIHHIDSRQYVDYYTGTGTSVSIGGALIYGNAPATAVSDTQAARQAGLNKTGSLADLVGFSQQPVKLGQTAQSKTVSEAVIAVPFMERNGERVLFNISRDTINEAQYKLIGGARRELGLSSDGYDINPGDTIMSMVEKMGRYVFPPKMDFITNEDVEPYAMYIFEFQHTFDQTDLINMWQNLPPKSATKMETQTVTITHELLASELLGLQQQESGKKLPNELQWMVFKVKQKANKDYFSKIFGSNSKQDTANRTAFSAVNTNTFRFNFAELTDDTVSSQEQVPDYSYNWPYDYFSLVELAQLDVSVTWGDVPLPGTTAISVPQYSATGTNMQASRLQVGQEPLIAAPGLVTQLDFSNPRTGGTRATASPVATANADILASAVEFSATASPVAAAATAVTSTITATAGSAKLDAIVKKI